MTAFEQASGRRVIWVDPSVKELTQIRAKSLAANWSNPFTCDSSLCFSAFSVEHKTSWASGDMQMSRGRKVSDEQICMYSTASRKLNQPVLSFNFSLFPFDLVRDQQNQRRGWYIIAHHPFWKNLPWPEMRHLCFFPNFWENITIICFKKTNSSSLAPDS